MIVLGLNARLDGHDPAAALLRDGELLGAVEEERFTGRRHAPGALPFNATAHLLRRAGIVLDEVDVLALGWDPRLEPDAMEPSDEGELLDLLLPPRLFPRRRAPAMLRVPHHEAHAAYAVAASPFERSACLVIDGGGERESVSGWRHGPGGLTRLWQLPMAHSLGIFYEAMSMFCGLDEDGAGKAMGLAAWGEPRFAVPSPLEDPPVRPVAAGGHGHYGDLVWAWVRRFAATSGVPGLARVRVGPPESDVLTTRTPPIPQPYRDLAASVQRRLEEDVLGLVRRLVAETGERDVCLTGGVALNCSANGVVGRDPCVRRLYVTPAAHDAGVAVGAAARACMEAGGRPRIDDRHVLGGPSWGRGAIADLLRGWGLRAHEPTDPDDAAVDLLAAGRVVARFAGGAEFGPRALGARSILARASDPGMLDRVNRLKGREPWRPLGPSLPAALAPHVFGAPVESPFMLLACQVEPGARSALPAIVHADGTARPQCVTAEFDAGYHRLLRRFAERTGDAALINTSFNVSGPIVLSPAQAVRTFFTSGIDALVIEGLVVTKAGCPGD
jgi:carbamoyltransferase